jgi:hypothetical protein
MARTPECVGFIESLCVYGFLRESICRFWCRGRGELDVRREEGGLDILKEVEEDGDASLLIEGVEISVIFSINHIKI